MGPDSEGFCGDLDPCPNVYSIQHPRRSKRLKKPTAKAIGQMKNRKNKIRRPSNIQKKKRDVLRDAIGKQNSITPSFQINVITGEKQIDVQLSNIDRQTLIIFGSPSTANHLAASPVTKEKEVPTTAEEVVAKHTDGVLKKSVSVRKETDIPHTRDDEVNEVMVQASANTDAEIQEPIVTSHNEFDAVLPKVLQRFVQPQIIRPTVINLNAVALITDSLNKMAIGTAEKTQSLSIPSHRQSRGARVQITDMKILKPPTVTSLNPRPSGKLRPLRPLPAYANKIKKLMRLEDFRWDDIHDIIHVG